MTLGRLNPDLSPWRLLDPFFWESLEGGIAIRPRPFFI
jgi:hypothetical protein